MRADRPVQNGESARPRDVRHAVHAQTRMQGAHACTHAFSGERVGKMMRGRRRWGRGHVPRGNGGPNTVTSLLCVERASHGGTIGGIPRPSLRLPRTIRACRAMAYGLAQGFELGASGSSMFCVFWTGASDPPMALLSTHGYLPAKRALHMPLRARWVHATRGVPPQ